MNFVELLQDYEIPYETEGRYCRPGWVQMKCPFCGGGSDPNKPYLGVNLHFNYSNCWNCGHHSLVDTLSELIGKSYGVCKKLLGGLVEVAPRPEPKRGKLVLPVGLGPLRKSHVRYLRERGFDSEQVAKLWALQGIGVAPKLAWRIFIPIVRRGRTVSWTTRSLLDTGTRYVSAGPEQEEVNHKTLLFGEDYVRHTIIVCEGPFDAMRIGPGAVALMGTGYSRAQVRKISKYPMRVICLDNEPAAQRRARELCDLLDVLPGDTDNAKLDAKDPASASDEEINELRKRYL